jgi:lysophospholipase L1-like esterase
VIDPSDVGHYLALGDSISIDLYPGLDVAEREGLAAPPVGLGAASLLHRNDDARWPAFRGRDLASVADGAPITNLCQDGATLRWLVGLQLPRVPDAPEEPVLATLTAGGNDLLQMLETPPMVVGEPYVPGAPSDVDELADGLERVVDRLRARFGASTVVVGTVYDPSDGTGELPGGRVVEGALETLHAFNDRVRGMAAKPGVRVADIHDRFLGHGLSEPDPAARWYWPRSVIEPSARGASEVRRLFLEALEM